MRRARGCRRAREGTHVVISPSMTASPEKLGALPSMVMWLCCSQPVSGFRASKSALLLLQSSISCIGLAAVQTVSTSSADAACTVKRLHARSVTMRRLAQACLRAPPPALHKGRPSQGSASALVRRTAVQAQAASTTPLVPTTSAHGSAVQSRAAQRAARKASHKARAALLFAAALTSHASHNWVARLAVGIPELRIAEPRS